MSLYPSLEDMKVDQVLQAQQSMFQSTNPNNSAHISTPVNFHASSIPSAPFLPLSQSSSASPHGQVYPVLAEYMGMELSEAVIRENLPEYLQVKHQVIGMSSGGGLVAPVSGHSVGRKRGEVSNALRQVVLCKDTAGKMGLRVKAVNKGVFVCLVTKGSPAAQGGLRFGDQILQVNGANLAGYSSDKVHEILKKASKNNVVMVVRDRPFERAVTLHKDSAGLVGFDIRDGKIVTIAVNSSAARNGLLIDHNLLEVNGQNVVGVKDKEIGTIIQDGGNVITVTIIPSLIYDHIVKNMASSLVKKMMDHSIPTV